jgi:hypothetical protein
MPTSLVGELCAYEGTHVVAHPVDPAHYLPHNPAKGLPTIHEVT